MRHGADRDTCYLIYVPYEQYDDTVPTVVMATGDGGHSWHPVFSDLRSGPEGSGAWFERSVLGPSPSSRIGGSGHTLATASVSRSEFGL